MHKVKGYTKKATQTDWYRQGTGPPVWSIRGGIICERGRGRVGRDPGKGDLIVSSLLDASYEAYASYEYIF